MPYAILFDNTRCIGCRACQVACKQWNIREPTRTQSESTELSQSWTNPPELSGHTFLVQHFIGEGEGDNFKLRFIRRSCMHCLEPACVGVCPVRAITKYKEGPVHINPEKCIGCRYCVVACPFHVAKYDPSYRVSRKCTMCFDRVRMGLEPACVHVCPTEALEFGERQDMIREAKERAAVIEGYIYGEKEMGGTSLIYMLDKEPSELKVLPITQKESYPVILREMLTKSIGMGVIGAVAFAAFRFVVQRRERVAKETGK